MTENLEPSIGYPEFLRTQAYPTFRNFFEVCNNLMEALDKLTLRSGPAKNKSHTLIRHLCVMTGISLSDVALLVGNGCGLGAMKITRTALEFAVNAEYLRLFPAATQRFLDWNWIEQYRRMNYMERYMPAEFATIGIKKIEETRTRYQNVRPQFESKGRIRGSWCELNLRERATKTQFEDAYNSIYVIGSEVTHGSFAGIAQHIEVISGNKVTIAVQPSMTGCSRALAGAHYCAWRAVHTLTQALAVDSEPAFDSLTKDFEYAWNEKPEQLKT